MANPLLKKLRGYQKAPRDRYFLLRDHILTQEEFLLYELGLAITDWDKTHIDFYGTFQATNQDLADMLGWSSDSTVSRYKKSLIRKGFFLLALVNRLQVKDFSSWELKKSSAKMQNTPAEIGIASANLQEPPAKVQNSQSKNSSSSLVSSKGNLSSSKEVYEYLSDEELDDIGRRIDQPTNELSINGGI